MTASSHNPEKALATDCSTAESSFAKIVRNSTFNVIGTMLIIPFNFVALFTLARRLGAESIGMFFTIFAISAVIHWIADAGISTVLTRRVARAPHDLRKIVGEASGLLLVVCLASATLFFLVAVPWLVIIGERLSWLVLVVTAVAMASRHALDFAANAFRGLERFEFENLSRVVQTATFCLFVWIGVHPGPNGTLAAFVAFTASNVIAALLIWCILLGKWHCAAFHLDSTVLRDWLRESAPLGFGDVTRQLLLHTDTLLLSAFRPAAIVGLFGVASRPLQPLQLVPRIIVSVTFPTMSRAAHVDRNSLGRMFSYTSYLLGVASLPICILISLCATPLILATAGPAFVDAAGALRLLIWATGLVFLNAQLRFVLTALDAERRYWRLITQALVLKLCLGLVLIPLWGLYGACVSNLFGELGLCVMGLGVLREMGVARPRWSQFLRVAPAACAMTLVLLPIVGSNVSLGVLAIASLVSLIVFGAMCLLFGVWPWSDVMRVWGVFRHWGTNPKVVRGGASALVSEAPEAALNCRG